MDAKKVEMLIELRKENAIIVEYDSWWQCPKCKNSTPPEYTLCSECGFEPQLNVRLV